MKKRNICEGMNDEPQNTHYAIHIPSNKIVFSWDYNGYDTDELRQFKKDYFIVDLLDMGMNPKECTILTRKGCARRGIDPTNDADWTNYPFNESKNSLKISESKLIDIITETIKKFLK